MPCILIVVTVMVRSTVSPTRSLFSGELHRCWRVSRVVGRKYSSPLSRLWNICVKCKRWERQVRFGRLGRSASIRHNQLCRRQSEVTGLLGIEKYVRRIPAYDCPLIRSLKFCGVSSGSTTIAFSSSKIEKSGLPVKKLGTNTSTTRCTGWPTIIPLAGSSRA